MTAAGLYMKLRSTDRFFLIAGPCAIESEELVTEVAQELKHISEDLQIPLILKGSYRKANRSRIDSFTSIGDQKALNILQSVGKRFGLPTITDIHETVDAGMAASFVDALQIPAFLCRQTDLLTAAAATGKIVNIKKGQFLSPESMAYAARKVATTGNELILLTERGTTFGYGDLVVDFRSIPIMKAIGYPVVTDVTHSLQQPNTSSGVTGGLPHLIDTIASAAIAAGSDGLFIETHPRPHEALSDGANMLPLHQLRPLLEKLLRIKAAIRE